MPIAALTLKMSSLVLPAAMALVSCSWAPEQPPVVTVNQPFAAGGNIDMRLESGDYTVRPAPDGRIRVTFAGNRGDATANLTVDATRANLAIGNTPHSNFRATLEIPATADLTIHLTAGNLDLAPIAGNKDIDSTAGNVTISIPGSNDYGAVDATVKIGSLEAGPFGNDGAGISPHVIWSGPGKYTLHAILGAGNLALKR